MHFTFAFRFPPLSKKERKRREEIAKAFIGQWTITSELPFAGTLSIRKDAKQFSGTIEFIKGAHSGETKEIANIHTSGEKIAFGLIWKRSHSENSIPEKWLCFGQLQEHTNQINGKLHLYMSDDPRIKKYTEFNWSASKAD